MSELARILIIVGVALLLGGLLLLLASRLGINLGRLPGDFVFRRGNSTIYIPLMTSLLLSIVLSLLMWFFRR